MAIALQAGTPVTGSNIGGSTTFTISVTVDAGSNRILVVCAATENNTPAITGITFGGVALTFLESQGNATWSHTEMWYLKAPSVSTADVVVTWASDPGHKAVGCYVLTGVDQTTPWRTPVKATGSSTSASVTVASVVSGDYLIDSLSLDSTGHATAPGANQTERWDIEPAAGSCTGISDTQAGADGGVMSHTWTTSAPYTIVACALKAASSGLSAALGLVTETELVQVLKRSKSKAFGLTTEADSVLSMTRRKSKVLGLSSEADVVQSLVRIKQKAIGLVTENDTALSIIKLLTGIFYNLGLVVESDTAQSIARTKKKALGLVLETDLSQSIARTKQKALGLVLETDAAQALSRVKKKALGLASETDLAQSFSRAKKKSLGLLTETDFTQPIVRIKKRILGLVTEVDLALAITKLGSIPAVIIAVKKIALRRFNIF